MHRIQEITGRSGGNMFDDVLAIIPARKGSKRLQEKNKIDFLGFFPMWNNTLRIAKDAGIKNIIISSDDEEILELLEYDFPGITRHRRSNETASDDALMDDVIREVIHDTSQDILCDTICLLQCTSPLLEPTTLKDALHQYYSENMDCLVAVDPHFRPCGAFYIFKKVIFEKYRTIWIPGLWIYVVKHEQSVDVDNIWDLRIAEAVKKGDVIRR